MEDYKREALIEIERELLLEDPVFQFFQIVKFQSRSKGKRRKRKFPKMVILIRPRGSTHWFFWDGENDCSLPWDKWATEVFGSSQMESPGDTLRFEINNLLKNFQKV